MTELDPAAQRLDAALRRLEAAFEAQIQRLENPDALRAEVSALVADRARLADALDQSLERERALQALADEASLALGAAIAEVRSALGSED